jgi:hypothetical protein
MTELPGSALTTFVPPFNESDHEYPRKGNCYDGGDEERGGGDALIDSRNDIVPVHTNVHVYIAIHRSEKNPIPRADASPSLPPPSKQRDYKEAISETNEENTRKADRKCKNKKTNPPPPLSVHGSKSVHL